MPPIEPSSPEGLYIHIPFCISKCPYCDFVVYAGAAARGSRSLVGVFMAALHSELDLRADEVDRRWPASGLGRSQLGSVYLGGGTPSLLTPHQVGELLAHADRRLGIAAGAEITVEADPGPEDRGDLVGFGAAGVTRVSIGAQSLDERELRRLGRRHSPEDVVAAMEAARLAGMDSISLDLLTDIPDQTLGRWRRTLAAALALGPDHLSVYTLTLADPDAEGLTGTTGDHLPVSRGARAWRDRARGRQSQDRAAAMEAATDELAAEAGLERYEIANLARPGHRSRHNLLYWRRRPYLGLGPGAHSSDGALERTWNAARLEGYLRALVPSSGPAAPGGPTWRPRRPPGGEERVDALTADAERAMLGLRLSEGLDAAVADQPGIASGLAWARAAGLAETAAGLTRLTPRGRLLADEVFLRLLP